MVISYFLYYIFTIIILCLHMLCYKELSNNKKIKINIRNVLFFLFISLIVVFNSYLKGILKPILSYLAISICNYLFFEDNFSKLFINSTVSYFFVVVVEIILSIIFSLTKISNLDSFNNMLVFKIAFSLLTLGFSFLICKNNFVKKLSLKIHELLLSSKKFLVLFMLFLLIPIIIDYLYTDNISYSNYFFNLILLFIFEFIMFYAFYNEIKLSKEIVKYENLLNFIGKYEKIIDEQRINKHEMHNNLLILKSYKNKNCDDFNEILNEMIKNYSKSDFTVKNMSKLPSGIKGIIYYKLLNIDNYNIKLNMRISKQLSFKKLNNNKEYYNLCKILNIILDNSIEAAKDSTERILNIEVYSENNNIIFYVENSFDYKLNVDKINNLHYSTKGKGRGFGLYVVNNILNSSEIIEMVQSVKNKMFITKIIVNI